jgi:hypothetical protein
MLKLVDNSYNLGKGICSLLEEWLPGGHREGHDYVALNPTRSDRTKGSFRIHTQTGAWIDHATGDRGGNIKSLECYLQGYGVHNGLGYGSRDLYRAAKTAIAAKVQENSGFGVANAWRKMAKDDDERAARAKGFWDQGLSLAGTPGEVYLKTRGISCVLPSCLRFVPHFYHKESKRQWPCVLAAIECWPDEALWGVHAIYLNSTGTGKAPVDNVKKTYGHLKGGAVRLGSCLESIVVCEGIETGLAIYQATGRTAWASLSCENMLNLKLPPPYITTSIILAGDNDGPGQRAASRAVTQWEAAGYNVRVAYPPAPYKDFNDVLIQQITPTINP